MRNHLLLVVALGSAGSIVAIPCASESLPASEWMVQPAASLSTPRAAHQATTTSPGWVLVTGGCSGIGCAPVESSAELLHAETGRRQTVRPMSEARVGHVAASLEDGRVLVAGGWTRDRTTASAEVFDPKTRSFSPVNRMAIPRMDAVAAPLLDGTVLVAGGASTTNVPLSLTEVFDPVSKRFVATAPMNEARAHHAAVRLLDGRVLVVGGLRGRKLATNSAEIYDPVTRKFTATGSMRQARCKHAAVRLTDGRVMVIAGSSDCDSRGRIPQTEIYDPRTGRFSAGPTLSNARYKIIGAATVLPSGEVVVAGDAKDVETWMPGAPAFTRTSGGIGKGLAFSTATPLPNGSVIVLGGYDDDIRPTAQARIVRRAVKGGQSD